jgi:hypothetical protein
VVSQKKNRESRELTRMGRTGTHPSPSHDFPISITDQMTNAFNPGKSFFSPFARIRVIRG